MSAPYLNHFHLTASPFSLTPDTDFCFLDSGFHEALSMLAVAINNGEGFVMVTGEPGAGKTLLCRALLNRLDAFHASLYLPNPMVSPEELYKSVAEELGVEAPQEGIPSLLGRINRRLIQLRAEGRQVLLFMDEAQTLPDESLEALRLLTNLETEKEKTLQVLLFGQPELAQKVAQFDKRQLAQRIMFAHALRPIARAEVGAYVAHRVRIAGRNGADLFTPGAISRIAAISEGNPRVINVLCHKAMMVAYGRGAARVDVRCVARAEADSRHLPQVRHWRSQQRKRWFATLLTLMGCGSAAALWYLKGVAG
ncbi:ExeA family protein [Magnetofaba australis]|uniref:Putative MSHA biogenesis protein MshM n=1 Tax=Magnetofaba australis IT-1 TaxID=1434232 RepID=A0A1Y2K189_9PROT|nr:AAA family ATPase [Magnetofaba australis]OSM01709.1 putative MSHA biogenesis protein MshM [Magnetofaba australis IT-1]